MKEKKQETQATDSKPKVKERWQVYKNKSQYGEYYSFVKGEARFNIPADILTSLIKRADGYFNKNTKNDNKGEG